MNCLVLGGAGFIGKHLCRFLVAAGHAVTSCDLPPAGNAWPPIDGVKWVEGDFSRAEALAHVLADTDVVFHLVSTTIPKVSNDAPIADLQSNVAGSLKLLDLLIRLPKPPKIIFASSGGTVYGMPRTIPIPETHPTEPLCAYGVGKLAIEKYLALYGHLHGLDYRILRLANPFGPGQSLGRGQGVIPIFLARAVDGLPLEIWGDGSVIRDYFHVDDLCAAMLAAMEYAGPDRVFNLGSGRGCSLNDLVDLIRRLMGGDVVCRYMPGRPCDVKVNILDIRLAAEELRWRPTVPLETGMSQLLLELRSRRT